MNKESMAPVFMAVALLVSGSMAAWAGHGVGITPESEFVTLSDMASAPVSPAAVAAPVAGDVSAVEGSGAPLQGEPVDVVASNAAAPVATNAVVPKTVETAGGVEVASNEVPETVAVASFPGTDKQNLISVALDDVPLVDVVRLFTKISGANIIATSTNLSGKVTVNLQEVEWKPALDSILDMYSLMVVEKVPGSTIYSIMPKAPGAAEPLISQTLFLNYAQVSNVAAIITRMVVPAGMVSAFPNANAMVVRGTAANLSDIRKVVEDIDVPRQQVYIEAKFLELTDEAIKDLGINWQVLEGYKVGIGTMSQTLTDSRSKFNGQRTGLGTVDSNLRAKGASSASGVPGSGASDSRTTVDTLKSGSSLSLADSTASGASSTLGSTGSRDVSDTVTKSANYSHESERINGQSLSDIRTAVLSASDFQVVLSALQQINGISIVSNPKIIVANQETAFIHIGENEPNIKGTVTPGQQGQANSTVYTLDERKPYFEFGISLEVTPTVNNQSNVSVRIEPKLSRYVRNKVAPDNNTYPVESTKTIKTTFSMESGKTAAIGGLTETTEADKVMKIPVLGDIPLLGKYLFSHTHKQRTQTETIIFVTVGLANPRTIQREEGMPEDAELSQKHMAAKAAAKNGAKKSTKTATTL